MNNLNGGILTPTISLLNNQYEVILPVILPLTFGVATAKTVTLPIELPMMFTSKERKTLKVQDKIKCVYGRTDKTTKIINTEIISGRSTTTSTKHILFDFEGLIIDEIVNNTVSEVLVMAETVQSRILIDIENVHRDKIRVSWSGNKVPGIKVYMKEQVDDSYGEPVGTFSWEDGSCDINVQAYSYDIKLIGTEDSGQSATVAIDEPFGYYIETQESISLNEKVYDIDVNVNQVYRINVNL